MKREHASVKASFLFSVLLSAIVLAANVVGAFATGSSDVGMTTFICFLPLAFYMAQNSHQQTRKYIEALEARVHQLEVGEATG